MISLPILTKTLLLALLTLRKQFRLDGEVTTHLILDAITERQPTISELYAFLDGAPDAIQMTAIQPPICIPVENGISGYVLLAESHCSYHGRGSDVHIDIFSCKSFDTAEAIRLCQEAFNLRHINSQLFSDRLDLVAISEALYAPI